MKMLGIGPGDEVLTVANSWISSSETISQTGAKPIFIDVDPIYINSMDEKLIPKAITANTKAIIAVHLHGHILQIDTIKKICDENGIALIEDCAQSHFSSLNGVLAGNTGIAGSFSFYPGKNLGAYGDAGCIITNDDSLAEKCKMYANHGALKKHQHQIEGINSRMDGLQAAILLAKLPYIINWTNGRNRVAVAYSKLFKNNDAIITPVTRINSVHSFHLYVILIENRDALKDYLSTKGIETAIHYPTILPLLPAYSYLNHISSDFPNAFRYQQMALSLPIFPEMTDDQINYVAEAVNAYTSKNGIQK
jgi:dTDP-4-amino-4,6-dideoxygalactose transaminase